MTELLGKEGPVRSALGNVDGIDVLHVVQRVVELDRLGVHLAEDLALALEEVREHESRGPEGEHATRTQQAARVDEPLQPIERAVPRSQQVLG